VSALTGFSAIAVAAFFLFSLTISDSAVFASIGLHPWDVPICLVALLAVAVLTIALALILLLFEYLHQVNDLKAEKTHHPRE
jgi:hypothetical protein